jgi:hypothetical protein
VNRVVRLICALVLVGGGATALTIGSAGALSRARGNGDVTVEFDASSRAYPVTGQVTSSECATATPDSFNSFSVPRSRFNVVVHSPCPRTEEVVWRIVTEPRYPTQVPAFGRVRLVWVASAHRFTIEAFLDAGKGLNLQTHEIGPDHFRVDITDA